MTQSAMSRLIKSLEEELGVKLLHRRGKVALPTSEGRLFYEHARKILEEYARMEQDISTATNVANGALRLGASRTPAIHLLPQVLYDFSKTHPDIRIDLSVCKSSSVVRDLKDGRIDVGIVESRIDIEAASVEAIAEDEVVIIAPEDHPLAKKKNVAIHDLTMQTFILPDPGSGTRELVDGFLRDAGLDAGRIRVRMTLGTPELIVRMVQAGMGLAFVSKWSVFTAVKQGTLKQLRVPGKKMKRHFYLIGLDFEPPAAAKTFRQFLKEYKFFIPF
jgi:DNA-binding transcriptional LysR family regulator